MATTIQLYQFTSKTSPVPADIVYLGDSANSFDEVQSTIAEVIGAYPALVSIGGLTTAANELIYTTASNTYAALSAVDNGVLITSNAGVISWLANGTAGYVLTANSGAPPSWQAAGYLTGSVLLSPSGDQTISAHNLFLTNGGFISGSATGPVSATAGIIQAVNPGGQGGFYAASYVNTSGSAPTFWSYKSRSTSVGSYVALQNNDTIGRYLGFGDDGSAFQQSCSMVYQVGGSVSSGIVPGAITFSTANTSGVLTSALTIDAAQLVTSLHGFYSNTTVQANTGLISGLTTGGTAGSLTLYSPTASKGSVAFTAIDNGANYANSLTHASTSAARTWTLPDASGTISVLGNSTTGSGAVVLANGPTFVTSTVTAPSITFSSTSGVIGTTTNNNAAAGSVGEVISSVVANASSVSLTNNMSTSVTSISLTAGDWDVYGNVNLNGGATTLFMYYSCWVGTSASTPDPSLWAGQSYGTAGLAVFAENEVGDACPFVRLSLGTTTTVYLAVVAGFSTSTCTACGGIYARRAR